MAHFHYTIMGGLVFAFFAGTYYWLPKMTGTPASTRRSRRVHFWGMFVAFNSTFLPLFAVGMLGMPRRVVTYRAAPAVAERLGLDLGVLPRRVHARLPRQPAVVADDQPGSRPAEPVGARSRSSGSCRLPVPAENFAEVPTILAEPYEYGVPDAPPGRRPHAAAVPVGVPDG